MSHLSEGGICKSEKSKFKSLVPMILFHCKDFATIKVCDKIVKSVPSKLTKLVLLKVFNCFQLD